MCLCCDSGNKVAVIVIMVIIKFMNTSLLVLILVTFFLANYQSGIEISILEGCTCVGNIPGGSTALFIQSIARFHGQNLGNCLGLFG